ncbi:hypothetical protein ACQKM2_39600 [Streptomyces sp. NPDC004126]|uniref:hypothetical protein n=1 Tax=Streptomyces sp. NPDC004126 TaxID=3390695 RepID=UPI003D000FE0
MGGDGSPAERIERLKALLVGGSDSARSRAALASGKYGNLLFGVALHGADARGSRALTGLEQLLVDALATVVEDSEVAAWGAAYRETVTTADPGVLTVPAVIAERPVSSGFTMADLQEELPRLAQEAWEAPNVSLLRLEDLAAGRIEEDEAFVEAMGERGFAVTGVARYPDAGNTTRADAGTGVAGDSWRVRMEMKTFYVSRAVGDQGGGRDEIYFTSAASLGEGAGQTFVSEEFGKVKQGQTRTFDSDNNVFIDQNSDSGYMVASVQVWEADQSSSRWYDALNKALNDAVTTIDAALESPVGIIVDPIPLPVAIGFEIAKVFISLMDALRNNDDLSCTRTFVLTRDDMAVLHHQGDLKWEFNGDGHHTLRVAYTGERPVYPSGSIEITSRDYGTGPTDPGPWSAPVPLGWKTTTTPALASYRDELHAVFSRPGDHRILWSRHDGTAWTSPTPLGTTVSYQPSALAVYNGCLHWFHTGTNNLIYHAWFDGQDWTHGQAVKGWSSGLAPSALADGPDMWVAYNNNHRIYVAGRMLGTSWGTPERVGLDNSSTAHSAPALSRTRGVNCVDHRQENDSIYSRYRTGPAEYRWEGQEMGTWRTRHAPTVHRAGQYEWMAHLGMDRRVYLSWRDTTLGWVHPADRIGHGQWTCTALGAPAFTTHEDRMYAIYHA